MSTISAPRAAVEEEEKEHAVVDPMRLVPWWGRTLLGLFLMGLAVLLLYCLVAMWPAVQAAAESPTGREQVTWLWWSFTLTPDAALLVLILLVSAVGSNVHSAISFIDYAGNRRLERSWVWWYLLRVFVGASLALLFYFAIRGGFFGGTTDSTDINPYGIAAVAGLVGLFSKQATDKLREIFDTAFRVAPGYGDDARSGGIVNPRPKLSAAEPEQLAPGEVGVVLAGSGFVVGSAVRVTRPDGVVVPAEAELLGPTRLAVTLETDDVATPGPLVFQVVNPEPGGGVSGTLRVEIAPEEEPGTTPEIVTPA